MLRMKFVKSVFKIWFWFRSLIFKSQTELFVYACWIIMQYMYVKQYHYSLQIRYTPDQLIDESNVLITINYKLQLLHCRAKEKRQEKRSLICKQRTGGTDCSWVLIKNTSYHIFICKLIMIYLQILCVWFWN